MTSLIIQFTGLALGVAIAGTFLARSADRIAELTGLGRLIIGSLLLAAVTSLPELTVAIAAVRAGLTDHFGTIRVSNGRRGSENEVTEPFDEFGLTHFLVERRALVI